MSDMVVVYLASPRAHGWMDWTRLDCLVASLKLLRLHCPPWPVIVFHEDYTEEDRQRLLAVTPEITFEQIDFSGEEQYHINHRPDNRVGTYGYCRMCQFFCGEMQRHPALQPYMRYLRLDDDSYIMEPLKPETLRLIQNHDYSYRSTCQEKHQHIWDNAVAFMKREGIPKSLHLQYHPDVPYNNFHVSSLAMWRKPEIQKFLQEAEAQHRYVQDGWTDASVHNVVIKLLGFPLAVSVYRDRSFAYRHNVHCCHEGQAHGKYCVDHLRGQYSWGPPACLEAKP